MEEEKDESYTVGRCLSPISGQGEDEYSLNFKGQLHRSIYWLFPIIMYNIMS